MKPVQNWPGKLLALGEVVWNPVSCRGNKIVRLILWNTTRKSITTKNQTFSETNWLRYLFFIFFFVTDCKTKQYDYMHVKLTRLLMSVF